MKDAVELLARGDGDRVVLRAPTNGVLTCAVPEGRLLVPGDPAGVLERLGRSLALRVPAGVTGRVTSPRPERVHAPVSYGQVLYELAPLDADAGLASTTAAADPEARAADAALALALRAPHSGRFWHRPAPGEPPFVEPGTLLEPGTPVGLIEVMKTFARIVYEPRHGLPPKARVVRYATTDGEEVEDGEPLVEVEPTEG